MPLWVWNGRMTAARVRSCLEGFRDVGFGGVFIHPRMGLVTEYLSEDWFALWRESLETCRRLGLECHIYDENSFPSGFAGGHVVSNRPRAAGRSLEARAFTGVFRPPSRGVAAVAFFERDADGVFQPREEPPEEAGEGWVVVEETPWAPDLWNGGFPYVDLTRGEVTREFLQRTHEQYAARFGDEFGGAVKYAFADEPMARCSSGPIWSAHLRREFRAEHGYALEDRLAAFLNDEDDAKSVRHDFWRTVNRLFNEHFNRPLHDWCAAHGLAYTGHFNEHEWPSPLTVPSSMASQRWMQAPGIDMLGFQFKPTSLAENAVYWMTLVEVGTVARQFSRARVLCETNGGGGYGMGPREFKPLTDFCIVGGVNLVNPHLSYQSIAGSRKMDWPQTISDHAPWWHAYRAEVDHEARLAFAMAQGRDVRRALVLHPTQTAWLDAVPHSFAHVSPAAERAHTRLQHLRRAQSSLVAALARTQLDFDLGDESLLAEAGRVEGAALHVGTCAYGFVLVPHALRTIASTTLALLRAYAEAGGLLLVEGNGPDHVDGRPQAAPVAFAGPRVERLPAGLLPAEVAAHAARLLRPHVTGPGGRVLESDLLHMRRELEGGELWLLANPWSQPLALELELPGGAVTSLDPHGAPPADTAPAGGRVRAHLALPPHGHALWWVTPQPDDAPPPAAAAPRAESVPVRPLGARRLDPNVLALDYVDLDAPSGSARAIHFMHANATVWADAGFERPLWEWTVQFRRTFLDAVPSDPRGHTLTWHFETDPGLDPAALASLRFALERPWLYALAVNGTPVTGQGTRWLDEDLRVFDIGALARPGANTVSATAPRFDLLHEVAAAYVLGDFALAPTARGFRIRNPVTPDAASWRASGLHFYPWRVAQQFEVVLPRAAASVEVVLPAWVGSAVRVRWADDDVVVLHPPFAARLGPRPAGAHRFEVELTGDFKNLLGPFFNGGLPGPWTWRQSPPTLPPGGDYILRDCGLAAPPEVRIR